jgi:HK97 family phage portal protein
MGILARAVKGTLPATVTFGGGGPFDQGTGFLARHGFASVLSSSGAAVGHTRALQIPAYSTAIRVIAEDVGGTPLISYRRTGDGRVRATDHPTYAVLHDAANPYMTAMIFRETLQAHCLGWGNGYASIVTDGQGVVTALWPLRPDMIERYVSESTGRPFWRYTLPSGETRDLRWEDVFHLPGLGFDGLTGYPVLSAMFRESIGTAIAQQEYVGRFYDADARPGMYLKTPHALSDTAIDRLKKDWDDRHAGFTNAHRTAVLEEGLDLATIGVSPLEQQLLESRKWSATEIAGQFRLAPWKVGVYDRATWGNVEDGNIDHLQSALRAWFVRWEQQLNLQVYGVGSEVYAEHLITAFLRGNSAARSAFYTAMRSVSAMSADEIRDAENLNRRGGMADDLFAPLNMAPITGAAVPPQRGTPDGA